MIELTFLGKGGVFEFVTGEGFRGNLSGGEAQLDISEENESVGGVHQWKRKETDVDDNTTPIQVLIEQKKKTATTIRHI